MSAAIDAAPGTVALPWLAETPFAIDGGHLEISYQSGARRFEIAPSVVVWGDSRLQFAGSVAHDARAPEGPAWAFALKSEGGWIGAELPAHERLPIEDWSAQGFLAPERGIRDQSADAATRRVGLQGASATPGGTMGAMALDIARVRDCFPALAAGVAYLDGPGGSQTPHEVADAGPCVRAQSGLPPPVTKPAIS